MIDPARKKAGRSSRASEPLVGAVNLAPLPRFGQEGAAVSLVTGTKTTPSFLV